MATTEVVPPVTAQIVDKAPGDAASTCAAETTAVTGLADRWILFILRCDNPFQGFVLNTVE